MLKKAKRWREKTSELLPALFVISSLIMAINTLVVVAKLISGDGIASHNYVIFSIAALIWAFDAAMAKLHWRETLMKHLFYSISMAGLFIAIYGAYLLVINITTKHSINVPYSFILGTILIGGFAYEYCRRALSRIKK